MDALQTYWTETAPYGLEYDRDKAIEIAMFMLRRYEAALVQIAQESPEWRAVAMDALGLRSMEQIEQLLAWRERRSVK